MSNYISVVTEIDLDDYIEDMDTDDLLDEVMRRINGGEKEFIMEQLNTDIMNELTVEDLVSMLAKKMTLVKAIQFEDTIKTFLDGNT